MLITITRRFCLILLLIVASTISTNFNLKAKDLASKAQILAKCPIADGFDFPVGKPNAKGYYNAQKFGKNYHLGEDWNGTGGGNSDLGDSVYAIANGIVAASEDLKGGWGNVVRIYHNVGNKQQPKYLESLYAHLQTSRVKAGSIVKKGEKIGTIGNANGHYLAHLHLELRDNIKLPIGPGYSKNTKGYLNPTQFIKKNRSSVK